MPADRPHAERGRFASAFGPIAWKVSVAVVGVIALWAIRAGVQRFGAGGDAPPDALADASEEEGSVATPLPQPSPVAPSPEPAAVEASPEAWAETTHDERIRSEPPAPEMPAAPGAAPVGIVSPNGGLVVPAPEARAIPKPSEVEVAAPDQRDLPPPERPTAQTLDDVLEAIVKFEVPLAGRARMQCGCGFLVDARGWVATNHHVVANASTAARVRFADGRECRLAGIVATSPEHDLALVKLEDPPPDAPVLDVGYNDTPSLGSQVYAFGHPFNADFSLSKGAVGRVLTTADLLASSQAHVVKAMKAPGDLVWVQHDAKISPGNSGGPLLAGDGRVIGVNTFVNVKAEFGYASHVAYLRELLANASEHLTPLPEAPPVAQTPGIDPGTARPGQVVVSAERMRRLFDTGRSFAWTPQKPEQYRTLADLAKQMTLAKDLQAYPKLVRAPPEAVRKLVAFTDQLFFEMRTAGWGTDQSEAINQFAIEGLESAGDGTILYTTVAGNHRNALLLNLDGTEQQVVVPVPPELSRSPRGTNWLVIGRVSSKTAQVKSRDDPDSRRVPIVLTHYMLKIR